MADYYSVRIHFSPADENYADLLASYLAEIDYESFLPEADNLTAYVRACDFSDTKLNAVLADFPIPLKFDVSKQLIEGEDWNSEWEKNYFQPIIIGNRCVVHSSFHKDVPKAEYDIVIDPKMAFGTGHHSTTNLIVSYLLDMDLKGKDIIDVGTGTAILAILCKIKGASRVAGIEIDPDAYENAIENCKLNHADVNLILGDASSLESLDDADLLIANINRNIILNDIARYASGLKKDGNMLLSGFYVEDIPVICTKASELGLQILETREDNNWAAIRLGFK